MCASVARGCHWDHSIDEGPQSPADAPEPDPWTHLEPLFTVQAWTNEEKCGHVGPIPEGSSFVCMGCHQAGKDGYKALPRGVRPLPDDPPEEPEADAEDETPERRAYMPSGLRGGIG